MMLEPWIFAWVSQLVLEEGVWQIVWREPLSVWRAFTGSWEWRLWQACILGILSGWLGRAVPRLRAVCLRDLGCRWRGGPDLTDGQWRDFRSAAPLLAAGCAAGTAASVAAALATRRVGGDAVRVRRWGRFATALVVATVAHGRGLAYALVLWLAARACAKARSRRLGAAATWAVAIGVLVAKEPGPAAWITAHFVDDRGAMRRWYAATPLMALRATSYALDRRPDETEVLDGLTYLLYAPLMATGPTMRYADFRAQTVESAHQDWAPAGGWTRFGSYAARTAVAWALMETATRRAPTFALTSTPGLMARLARSDPLTAGALVLAALNVLWLKFAVVWRFARALALLDGVDPPENMRRFVCDNTTIAGFWRGWHSSFATWIQVYLYRPLVAARVSKSVAVFAVFAFVVLWHDLQPDLAVWGALNVLGLLVERKAGLDASINAFCRARIDRPLIRAKVALSGALYLTCLVVSNAIGYAHGLDGALVSLGRLPHLPLLPTAIGLLAALFVFFVAVQHALRVRQLEARFDPSL